MKVILLKNIDNLGKQGEIKEVNVGYARNYLIPRGLADLATPELIAQLERRQVREAKRAEHDLKATEKMAAELDGQEFEVSAKSAESGSLYSSLTPAKVADIINSRGYSVSKDQVAIEPIKSIGEHEIPINFGHGLEVKITLLVQSEKG